jgi:hypothetical protein
MILPFRCRHNEKSDEYKCITLGQPVKMAWTVKVDMRIKGVSMEITR